MKKSRELLISERKTKYLRRGEKYELLRVILGEKIQGKGLIGKRQNVVAERSQQMVWLLIGHL